MIALPLLIFLVSIRQQGGVQEHHSLTHHTGSHLSNLWWVRHQAEVAHVVVKVWPFLNVPFPLDLAQNVLAAGLIDLKIWLQHRQARVVGIVALNRPSLVAIVRILVESAAVYTIGTFLTVVLRALDHPARFIIHSCLVPITGKSLLLQVAGTSRPTSNRC